MRIVHLATTVAGGAGIGLWRYHRALRAQGIDSRILVMDPPTGTEGEVGKVHWRKRPLPFRLARRLGLVRTVQERLRSRIAELDRRAGSAASYELFSLPYSDYRPEDHPWVEAADVVNLHWVSGLLDWPRFLRRVRKPLVMTLHDQQPYLGGFHYALDAENNPHLATLEAEMKETKRQALRGHRIAVIANSRWNEEQARRSGFFPAETRYATIYYPLDTSLYRPIPSAEAKTASGLEPGGIVVGFACENLNNRRKGFADLIETLALLPEALRARVTLLSFGREPTPELRSRVTLPWRHLGFLDDDAAKVSAYAAMDVFVVPSRAEAFGLTAIEAQAVGIPVVAPPVGGLAEAVAYARDDHDPGQTVPRSLVATVTRLLTDPARYAARAESGRHAVAARHDPAGIGRTLAEFHRHVRA